MTALADGPGDFSYSVNDDNSVTITGYSGSDTNITIPSAIDGHPVTAIGDQAFLYTDIANVTIPSGVTCIGSYAFSETKIATVLIPDTVDTIGDNAFSHCSNLTGISVDASNAKFYADSGVLFSKKDDGNTDLVQYPIGRAGTGYDIPDKVEIIWAGAFEDAVNLTKITIPKSVTDIYNTSISPCESLTEIDVDTANPNFANHDGDGVLYWKDGDGEVCELVVYPAGNPRTNFTIPDNVNTVDDNAFASCSIQTLKIPAKTVDIRDYAFSNSTFSAIIVDQDNAAFSSQDGVLFNKSMTKLVKYPGGDSRTSYTIPGGIKTVCTDAFDSSANLTDIGIPDGVASLEDISFTNCTGLKNITLPKSIGSIGLAAFQNCTSLSTVKFLGNAPSSLGLGVFAKTKSDFKILYPMGAGGWTSPTWKGYPTEEYGYTVTFDSQGGSSVAIKKAYETVITAPVSPSKSGYLFNGWYKESACKTKWDFASDKVMADTKLYAGWTAVIPVDFSAQKTDATRYSVADGSITLTASGGNSGTYQYSINGGANWQSSAFFSGLGAGTYTVIVRDASNTENFISKSITIGQLDFIGNVSANKIPATANVGSALTIIPPSPPKNYTVTSIDYKSSNPGVAAVDTNGNVTFLSGGKTTITTTVVFTATGATGAKTQAAHIAAKTAVKKTIVKKTIIVHQLVASISLNKSDATITRTKTVKLVALLSPASASNKKVKWTSSNTRIATVSKNGVVMGKAAGTVIITCTALDGSKIQSSCTITVAPIYPSKIKVSKASLQIKKGKTATLKAVISPSNSDFKSVTWSSSDTSIAVVSASGKITGISAGKVTITATISNGLSSACIVEVK